MSNPFFDRPILNSPYAYPARHWELDKSGQPTQKVVETRRRADFVTPIPAAKLQSAKSQKTLLLDERSTADQQYSHTAVINAVRAEVDKWRALPDPAQWRVTPETARLLQHWRHHEFTDARPFFCQVEAVETAIWLTEVAPQMGKQAERFIEHLASANAEANPGLARLGLKLATGAGKTTVMAMLIAWQTINAVRHPGSKRFTRGFLIVAPGLTIRDRLRVLYPNDADSYYRNRELVPSDMQDDLNRAAIVITNYHAFKLRERVELSKGGRQLLQGRTGDAPDTLETKGQMLQRVMPELMAMSHVMVINDEAHHCYREKASAAKADVKNKDETADDKEEAKRNREAARLWISGIEAVNEKIGVSRVMDLSATPFFLRGSGYDEGTLFPWTLSDFSLMDAIECGIVKLPRVPITDNTMADKMPMFRNLWEHIRKDMPKKGRGKAGGLDPHKLPTPLLTALEALYGHYAKTFELWEQKKIGVPPCFIVVCNNTSASKLVYDYISGYVREEDGSYQAGQLALFRNYDEHGNPLGRPRTLLIDSEQLESGDALDPEFRTMAADEIERFRREIREREGPEAGDKLTEQQLLREVMNTVGKPGRLGDSIRCVVSVSMLTEGWDTNTVTHVLGVRAFGTQLLCEQVIGRALRRQSYVLNAEGLFDVEYADVLGIPFDFNAEPVVAPPQAPRETVRVTAVKPDRDALEIRFPRVQGYRVELPPDRITATFDDDSTYALTPEKVGAAQTRNSGIVGEQVDLTLVHTGDVRQSTVIFELARHLVMEKWREPGEAPKLHLFNQLKRCVKQWLDEGHLVCKGGTFPAQLMWKALADEACERIVAGIVRAGLAEKRLVQAVLDPYNPTGSTAHVAFNTTKADRWQTAPDRCHINWVVLDSKWEAEFCRIAEVHPRVRAYVKNHNLNFEVPYHHEGNLRRYRPDFIVRIDDGRGDDDLLNLVVEIKGYRGEDAKAKRNTMDVYWVEGVNRLGSHGRWAFAEFTDVWAMESEFAGKLTAWLDRVVDRRL